MHSIFILTNNTNISNILDSLPLRCEMHLSFAGLKFIFSLVFLKLCVPCCATEWCIYVLVVLSVCAARASKKLAIFLRHLTRFSILRACSSIPPSVYRCSIHRQRVHFVKRGWHKRGNSCSPSRSLTSPPWEITASSHIVHDLSTPPTWSNLPNSPVASKWRKWLGWASTARCRGWGKGQGSQYLPIPWEESASANMKLHKDQQLNPLHWMIYFIIDRTVAVKPGKR